MKSLLDQYFGTKELYHVVLKANTPMRFGERMIAKGEPVLYFQNVTMAALNEQDRPIMARGGWGNMPHVIWDDRSEMTFTLSEGVMTSIGMGILTSARMLSNPDKNVIYLPDVEGPFDLDTSYSFKLKNAPTFEKGHQAFCYEYERDVPQKKMEYEVSGKNVIVKNGDRSKQYIFDYYYEYGDNALIYLIEKERFNGTFILEAKFYTKDENDGLNYTNIITMPKVRVVSDINLRLGERADPTVSVFNIIAMPEMTKESRNMLMKIVRLDKDLDADI